MLNSSNRVILTTDFVNIFAKLVTIICQNYFRGIYYLIPSLASLLREFSDLFSVINMLLGEVLLIATT